MPVQPSSAALAFICCTKPTTLPPTSHAMTLAASLALTMSIAFSRSMRRTVSPMRSPMVVPLAFWISLNSCVRSVGTVTSPFRSLPLSTSSRAVISLVRLATYFCWSAFWFRMVLPVSALNRYTASVSVAVWTGMGYTANTGSTAERATANVSTSAARRRQNVL